MDKAQPVKPGVYTSMSAPDYFAQDTYIPSSVLIKREQSAKHFLHEWTTPSEESTNSQERGTFFHDLILEQNIDKYVPRPVKDGRLIASNTKDYAAFLEQNPGKTPLHPDDYNDMSEMLTSICENKLFMNRMNGAKIECSIFARDPETGLFLKARPDIWKNLILLDDLKSTKSLNTFKTEIYNRKYDVRLIHYAKVIEYATGEKVHDIYLTPFESKPPYCSDNYKLSPGDRSAAEDQWRMLINQVAVNFKDNRWPGPHEEVKLTQRPKYLMPEEISFEEVG